MALDTSLDARFAAAAARSGIPERDLRSFAELGMDDAIASVMEAMGYAHVGGERWQHDGHRGVVIVSNEFVDRLRRHESLAQVTGRHSLADAVILCASRCAQNTAKMEADD